MNPEWMVVVRYRARNVTPIRKVVSHTLYSGISYSERVMFIPGLMVVDRYRAENLTFIHSELTKNLILRPYI